MSIYCFLLLFFVLSIFLYLTKLHWWSRSSLLFFVLFFPNLFKLSIWKARGILFIDSTSFIVLFQFPIFFLYDDWYSFILILIISQRCDFDGDYKDVGVAQFTTKYFVVRNCLPNAKSDMLLSAWNPPPEWGKYALFPAFLLYVLVFRCLFPPSFSDFFHYALYKLKWLFHFVFPFNYFFMLCPLLFFSLCL